MCNYEFPQEVWESIVARSRDMERLEKAWERTLAAVLSLREPHEDLPSYNPVMGTTEFGTLTLRQVNTGLVFTTVSERISSTVQR